MVLKVAGQDAGFLETEVQRLIKSAKAGPVVVDMRGVSFLVSSSIAQVVRLSKHAKRMGWEFEVVNVGDDLYGMLETLRLTKVLAVRRAE